MGLYTELFYAIIPTLVLCFFWSAIPTSRYISILVHVTYFSSRCMHELKFANYHRTASLSSRAFSVYVCSICWRIINQTRLSSNTPCTCTNCISISAILCNNCTSLLSGLCVCSSNHHARFQTCKKAMSWCTARGKFCCFVRKPLWKSHAILN